jgi:hypothetical protein
MTKREAERIAFLTRTLVDLGFTPEEVTKLRRISSALNHWHELECGTDQGAIERDGPDGTGRPRFRSAYSLANGIPLEKCPIAPDREKGALARLAAICKPHSRKVVPYVQSDPRGCALYLVRVARLREYEKEYAKRQPTWTRDMIIDSVYSSAGIAVY